MKNEKQSTIIDPKVQEWIDSLQDNVDVESVVKYIDTGSKAVCNFLIKSAAAKIAIIDGINKANDILKHSLNTDIEITLQDVNKHIDLVSDFEMFTLAVKSMPLQKSVIDDIIQQKIETICQKAQSGNEVINLLRKHLEDIHKNVGELPDPNIHNVRMARNAAKRDIKPFGIKQK